MFSKIDSIIKEKKLTPADCEYHTLRNLENNGKVRALVIKGDSTIYIEAVCPFCGKYSYLTQPWGKVSKGAKYRFSVTCPNCGKNIKIEKLKGKTK